MRNLDIFDTANQPMPESELPEVGAMPADGELQQVPAAQEVGEGGTTTISPSSTIYTPKSEVSQALIENQELFSELEIDGNRYDQFVAETLPKVLDASPQALATVGTPKFYQQIAGRLIRNESGGNYGAIEKGSAQAFGKYQFTPQRLKDLGYTKGIKEFLKSPDDQESIFTKHMDTNYKWLLTNGMITPQSSPAEVSGYLYAMHLGGYGGAKSIYSAYQNALQENPNATIDQIITSKVGAADSNGTRVGKYFIDGFKYGSKLLKSGSNGVDDVIYNEALNWARDGKNSLADRDQAVSRRGNAWLNTLRQKDNVLEAVDDVVGRMGTTRQSTGDYFTSNRDADVIQHSGVAEEELTFWDRFNASRKETYLGTTSTGIDDSEIAARRSAEQKLAELTGSPVDIEKSSTESGVGQYLNNLRKFTSTPFSPDLNLDDYGSRFDSFLASVRKSNPDLKLPYNSYDDVLIEAGKAQLAREQEYERISQSYGGIGGGVAGFTGALVGTLQDPLEVTKMLATAPIGAGGSLAYRAGASAIAGAVSEVPTQVDVYQSKEAMGLNPSIASAIAPIAMVGALSGAVPVIGHYAAKGFKATKELFGQRAAVIAEDVTQLEKNSPFPEGIDGEDKLSAGLQKARSDIESGNPVAVVADNAPAIKQDIRQQLSPDGNISFKEDNPGYPGMSERLSKDYDDAVEYINSLGTATKEEYDALVSRTPKSAIDKTQALQRENNPVKALEKQDIENIERTRDVLEVGSKTPQASTKTLVDTLEQQRAKASVDDLSMDEVTTSQSILTRDQLDSLSGTSNKPNAAIEEMRAQRTEVIQRERVELENISSNLNSFRGEYDKLKIEYDSISRNSHRSSFLKDALEDYKSTIRLQEKIEKESIERVKRLEAQLTKIDKLESKILADREAFSTKLSKLEETKGSSAVQEEISKRQAELTKTISDYEKLLKNQRDGVDTKIDFYEGETLSDSKLVDQKTARELIQEAQDELDFLKEAADCLIRIGA